MGSVALQLLQLKDAFLAKAPVLGLKSTPTELKIAIPHLRTEVEI